MAVRLTITEWGDPSSEYVRSFLQDSVILGRARSADVCLPDMSVSTRHAEIRLNGGDYVLVDLGSANGTTVNGTDLIAHRPRKLAGGDTIAIAGFKIHFRFGVAGASSDARDESVDQARVMLSRILGRTLAPDRLDVIVVVQGKQRGARFELPPPPCSFHIGRSSECGIRLDDLDVSRKHAEVVVENEGVFLRDGSSRNGILVDDERIDAIKLVPGVHVVLGRTMIALEHPAERSLAAIFEAPEEETASFSLGTLAAPVPPIAPVSESSAPGENLDSEEKKPVETVTPGIGPRDPLAPEDPLTSRSTGSIPIQRQEQPGSDMGLIVIGAVIIVAAVALLVYLFS